MKKITIVLLILLSYSQLFANKNDFKPGFVVKSSGDTLIGYIKSSNWRINPSKIVFTSTLFNTDTTVYTIKDINGFTCNDFIFVKRKVKIDIQPNELTELTQSNTTAMRAEDAPTFKEDIVLLRVLVRGRASLYSYTEASGRSHYYLETDVSEIQELLNTMFEKSKYEAGGATKHFVGYAQEYKNQLLTSLIGCKSITYKQCDIDYKESELKKLVMKFNQCVEPDKMVYANKKEELSVKPYVGAGIAFASMKFKSGGEYYNYFIDADFTKPTSFTANFGIKFIIPRYSKKLSIYSEFAYNSYHFDSQVNQIIGFTLYSLIIDYAQVGLNLGMSYDLSKNKMSPYLKAGLSMLYTFNYTMEATNIKYGGTYDFWPYPRKLQMGLNFGAGINFGNLAFEYQFLAASGFSSKADLKNTPITNSLLLKYSFGKNEKQ
jgi:hypothetical protein